jgi:hypothetical protein
MSGRKYVFGSNRERITLEKQWHSAELLFPLQTVVADIEVHDAAAKQYRTIEVTSPSSSVVPINSLIPYRNYRPVTL